MTGPISIHAPLKLRTGALPSWLLPLSHSSTQLNLQQAGASTITQLVLAALSDYQPRVANQPRYLLPSRLTQLDLSLPTHMLQWSRDKLADPLSQCWQFLTSDYFSESRAREGLVAKLDSLVNPFSAAENVKFAPQQGDLWQLMNFGVRTHASSIQAFKGDKQTSGSVRPQFDLPPRAPKSARRPKQLQSALTAVRLLLAMLRRQLGVTE